VQELADAINSVDQKTVQNWLEIGKNIAIAGGVLLLPARRFNLVKDVWDVLNPSKERVFQMVSLMSLVQV
jgi:hypothetical protein